MATKKHSGAAPAAPAKDITEQAGLLVPVLSNLDRENLANEANAIASIVSWVVQAHSVLESIRTRADHQPELEELLSGTMFRSPVSEFDIDVAYLLIRQRQLIDQLAGVDHG